MKTLGGEMMSFVSVTRLRLRSPLYLPAFFTHAVSSFRQAKQATGNLQTTIRRQGIRVFWTLTVWHDEASMRAYMTSGSHRQAMPKLAQWCDEASVTHWQQESAELPSWQEAEQHLRQFGRLTKLPHPSPAQAAGIIDV
ncbi:DUF3291 domain-containing protein [Thermocoleostomius sinensis]|uniref:DUF3291 domain-containing protein n=1 Tax=Thermocoleostomius sinensis A174 TaxID=2016057 RepID=A0A9E9CAM9_9CYAN|nr:DUF3291 domain-containing protein [Thermocoleostomius sinensis]WAL61187.1 DUF3291 domain-containing protein [Thermocoleostomius sinensis A174]